VKEALPKAKIEAHLSNSAWSHRITSNFQASQADQILRLVTALEEHDDVQHVYANFDTDEPEIQATVSTN
jgi:transcriptional/translational regulatory protein YebC/TACO1